MTALKGVSRTAVAFASLVLIASLPDGAQPKPATNKTVFENVIKVAVIRSVSKPGEGLPTGVRGEEVLYYLSGGKIERTFADGTKATSRARLARQS